MTEVKTRYGKVLFSYDETTTTLKEEIRNHKDLNYADLEGADLSGANLSYANLIHANLRGANLSNAELSGANFVGADLECADLTGANLRKTYLYRADLTYTNLRNVNLSGADLYKAVFFGAQNIPDNLPMACPSDGAFIAWKKVYNYLVKLEIPEDAKRSSANSNKCRCDKAMVLEITDLKTNQNVLEVRNYRFAECSYKVGKMVYPDSFDENRWDECSNGIHFFINKQDAINF